MNKQILLKGITGSNPLGFLASLGVVLTASQFCPSAQMSWVNEYGTWRPIIWGYLDGEQNFLECLYQTITSLTATPFDVDKKLPFSAKLFLASITNAQEEASPDYRRIVDLLAGFGSEIHCDEKGIFEDTAFRMVRSGDSAGQGLLSYALAIRKGVDRDALQRTLFQNWDYRDDDYNLRWDPVEDQRYALRWYDPSPQTNKKFNLKTMRGANALALEALSLFPVQPKLSGIETTGFSKSGSKREKIEYFTWPIWEKPISLDSIRSLLALSELHKQSPPREALVKRGIVEIYRCERIAPNKYYKNFSPPVPA